MQHTVGEQIQGLSVANTAKLNEIVAKLKAETISKSESFRQLKALGFTHYAISKIASAAVGKLVRPQFVYNVLGPKG